MAKSNITLEDLDFAKLYISNEGVGAFFTNSAAVKKLSSMASDAKSFFKTKFNPLKIFFNNNQVTFDYTEKFANNAGYMDVRKITIRVPEGFKAKPVELIELLVQQQAVHENIIEDMIKPFSQYIAKLVANPALLTSTVHDYRFKPIDHEKFKKEIQKYMSGSKKTEMEFGEVYPNMNTLAKQVSPLRALVNGHDRVKIDDVKKAVDELYVGIDKVIAVIESNGNNIQPSKHTMDALANIIYQLAVEVETFAVINSTVTSVLYAFTENENTYKSYV